MNKIKEILKSLAGDKWLWHFADDFGTFVVAGAPAALAVFALPADADAKVIFGSIVGLVIAIAYPAFRRAWKQDSGSLTASLASDVGLSATDVAQEVSEISLLVDLAEKTKTGDPAAYDKLIAEVSTRIEQLLLKFAPAA
jgi:hypothetical protein